jgi:glycosyltransferase involved in cell wall biosynthesis
LKIVLFSSFYYPYIKGGGEISVQKLAEGLAEKNISVFVISTAKSNSVEWINGIKIYRIKHKNLFWSFKTDYINPFKKLLWHLIEGYNPLIRPQIENILNIEKPDLAHVRNSEEFSGYLYKLLKDLDIPSVVTLNSYTWLCPKSTMYDGSNCLTRCLSCRIITYPKRMMSTYVNTVVGVSKQTLEEHTLRNYFTNSYQFVAYTSLPDSNPKSFSPKGITFGMIGRIHPTKGQAEVIKLFNEFPENELIVAGTGPDHYVKYCRENSKSKSIIFFGNMDQKDFFDKIDVLIINSLWREPFPRTLIEAFSYGVPVISSNMGGTKEKISQGKTGFIYHDFSQLRGYIDDLRSNKDLLNQMKSNILEDLSSWPDEIDSYQAIYKKTLKI